MNLRPGGKLPFFGKPGKINTSEKMIFWQSAFDDLLKTVGQRPPETGGLLFGDRDGDDSFVIKKFVFDNSGHRSHVSYDPDPDVVNAMIKKVWEEEGLALIGWCHSHPRGISRLSGNYGGATGDLGYIEAILKAIPALDRFLIPIVHSVSDGHDFEIHPYIAHRGRISDYARADLKVIKDHSEPKQSHAKPAFDQRKLTAKLKGAVDTQLLNQTSVLAIGAGGANGIYENFIRMGVGHLSVMDFDTVDDSNLVTQGWFSDQIGKLKVEALKENAKRLIPVKSEVDQRFTALPDNFLELSDEALAPHARDADLLMFMTDSFHAQARGNRLALKHQKPAIFAMMYEGARACEITFTIPGVTPGCHRCATSGRYQAYLDEGFENDIGSEGSFIFQTQALNSLIGILAMAILHRDTQGYEFSGWFGEQWERNLIQTRLSPKYESRLFGQLNGHVPQAFAFDSIWQKIEPERPPSYAYHCPDCGGSGDLDQAKIKQTLLSPLRKAA